jgi:ubiquinone/menaquinone biosynthesis C-methylase UbiE
VSLYGRLFARIYDRALADTEAAGLADRRAALLAGARGRVLELGAGTGLNLPHYPARLERLVLTEPEEPMRRRLHERAQDRGATVVAAPAERLPFDDASFDTVVATLTLCTVDDLPAALAEARRVLVPGGRLLFCEHVRSGDPRTARRQDLLTPLWRHVGHGCHPNRDTLAAIEASGLRVAEVEHGRVPHAPRFLAPLIAGVAVRPPS